MARDCRARDHELLFRLARRLRGLDGATDMDVAAFRPAFEAFCAAVEKDRPAFTAATEVRWIEFAHAWDLVKTPDSQDAFGTAVENARAQPIQAEPAHLGADYCLVASIAYHLQRRQGAEPIMLPVERVANALGRDKVHASRLVRLLARNGLLESVEPPSYTQHRAATYRFRFTSKGRERGDQ